MNSDELREAGTLLKRVGQFELWSNLDNIVCCLRWEL